MMLDSKDDLNQSVLTQVQRALVIGSFCSLLVVTEQVYIPFESLGLHVGEFYVQTRNFSPLVLRSSTKAISWIPDVTMRHLPSR